MIDRDEPLLLIEANVFEVSQWTHDSRKGAGTFAVRRP
jgi:hypothetical protein